MKLGWQISGSRLVPFARWWDHGLGYGSFPLTPALSRGERENHSPLVLQELVVRDSDKSGSNGTKRGVGANDPPALRDHDELSPLPQGGGQGEGERDSRQSTISRSPADRNKHSGFTLIEMVLSAAIMSIILTGAYLCLSSGLRSQKVVESRADMVQSARVAIGLMCADLRCAKPLSKEFEFLGMQRTLGEAEADNLDFGTCNYTPKRAREGDFCEVSYYLAEEPESGTLGLWRRRDATPDDEPLSGGSREEIARGVRELRLEYYDGFDWFDTWGDPSGKRKKDDSFKLQPNLSGLPEAVRITLSIGSTRPKERDEPPLTFQTVCRLNLAGAAENSGGLGSGAGKGEAKDQSAPEGGAQ